MGAEDSRGSWKEAGSAKGLGQGGKSLCVCASACVCKEGKAHSAGEGLGSEKIVCFF